MASHVINTRNQGYTPGYCMLHSNGFMVSKYSNINVWLTMSRIMNSNFYKIKKQVYGYDDMMES